MNIQIVCVGKLKERYWRDAAAEYGKRLGRYCRLTIHDLKEERLPERAFTGEEQAVVVSEGKAILRALRPGSYVIACAIQGKRFSSEQLAQKLDQLAIDGRSDISFLIGGSLGLSEEVLAASDLLLSFSAMTFPHQMMRVILLEQTYRAFKINHNETYHK